MKHMACADVFSTTYEFLTMKHMAFTVKHMGRRAPKKPVTYVFSKAYDHIPRAREPAIW
jgi:hypothetical protein